MFCCYMTKTEYSYSLSLSQQMLALRSITFPCAAGSIPALALQPVTFGSGKPEGLPISHLWTGCSHARHTAVILPGQE